MRSDSGVIDDLSAIRADSTLQEHDVSDAAGASRAELTGIKPVTASKRRSGSDFSCMASNDSERERGASVSRDFS